MQLGNGGGQQRSIHPLARLRELVCDRGQGFYYARPQPPEQLTALLTGGIAPEPPES